MVGGLLRFPGSYPAEAAVLEATRVCNSVKAVHADHSVTRSILCWPVRCVVQIAPLALVHHTLSQ